MTGRMYRGTGYCFGVLASALGGLLLSVPCAVAEWNHGTYSENAIYTDTNNWVGGVIDGVISTNTTATTGGANTEVRFTWNFSTNHTTGPGGMLFDYTLGTNVNLILASSGGIRTLTLNGDFTATVPSGRFGTGGAGGINLDLNGGKRTFTLASNMRFQGGDISNGAMVFANNPTKTPPLTDVGGDSYQGCVYYGTKSYTGETEVTSGLLRLSLEGGAAPYSSSFTIHPSCLLQVGTTRDEPAVDRVGDDAPIKLISGNLDLHYGCTTNAGTEDLGPISMDGYCHLYMGRNEGATTAFTATADRLERIKRSVGFIESISFPTNANDSTIRTNITGDITARLKFDTALPVIGGGGGVGTTTISVVPFMAGRDGPLSPVLRSLTTYNETEGLRVLKIANELVTVTNGVEFMAANANDNVRAGEAGSNNTTVVALTGDKTVNALVFQSPGSANVTISGAYKLTVTSGAVYSSGGYNSYISVATLDFGMAEGIIQAIGLRGDRIMQISASIEGSGGVTIGLDGLPLPAQTSGRIRLTGASTYSGTTTVTKGIIRLFGSERLPNATEVNLHTDATLEVSDTETIAGVSGDGTLKLFSPAAACVLGSGSATAGQVKLETGGCISVDSTDSLSVTGGDLVVNGGTWSIGLSSDTLAGRVDVDGNLVFNANALAIALENGYAHRTASSWDVASATSITGLPHLSGYSLEVIPGTPQVLRLSWAPPTGTIISIR